jgi:hypothetical protein
VNSFDASQLDWPAVAAAAQTVQAE